MDPTPLLSPRPVPPSTVRPALIAACAATVFFLLAVVVPLVPFGFTPAADAQTTTAITPTGVGSAVVGSTVAQLRTQLGPDYTVTFAGTVLVDVQGYEIRKAGELVFIAAAVTGVDRPAPDEPLEVFIVDNPGPATTAGISVGSTVTDAVAVYGAATLSFNVNTESREFASFARQPANISFRTGVAGDAGIFPPSDAEFQETTEFKPAAPIVSIWVQCRTGVDCPPQPSPLPYTGQAHRGLLTVATICIAAGLMLVGIEQRSSRATCK